MKLFATICGVAALFTAAITHQILRKFGAMFDEAGIALPGHAQWLLWGQGALPPLLLAASAVVVVIGLVTGKSKWMLAGGASGILLMLGAATFLPAAIMTPLARLVEESGPRVVKAPDSPLADAPPAVDPSKVGSYPSMVGQGGGHFYDEVLEYRVRVPVAAEENAPAGADSYFVRHFATHAEALEFAVKTPGAQKPLALVMQTRWINEPEPGRFESRDDVRLAEWQVEWLAGAKRLPGSIDAFIRRGGGPVSPGGNGDTPHIDEP